MPLSHERNPVRRFSNRAADYAKYRPGYPESALECIRAETGLSPSWIVADVGSGTGILTRMFLDNGNAVFAVEPNLEMRLAGELELSRCSQFRSVNGTAEATALAPASIDLVVAGQAFHWFDVRAAKPEFIRILKTGGWVSLLWNTRERHSTPFMRAYEDLLLTTAIDYEQVDHRKTDAGVLATFFAGYQRFLFTNRQSFNFDGLKGRLMSCSYVPAKDHPQHGRFAKALESLYTDHERNGTVTLEYQTEVYIGQVGE